MSTGHNVTSHPDASPKCENPEGADPFHSYEDDDHFAIMDVGEVFEHEFTVAGEYVYVCTPHAGQGMVGSVTVTK
jgi:plastocyanin